MALWSVGTDVELFAQTKGGSLKSLCGLIGGTKEEPMQISGLPKGFCLQEDNVSVEFNIPPSNSANAFVSSIDVIMQQVTHKLDTMNLEVSKLSAGLFDLSELQHPNAMIFGCEPDYDAWKKVENRKPTCDIPNLRTAGGHVHVGTDRDMLQGIQSMDAWLGVPSIIIDKSESSKLRRQLYGKAGAMRPKSYGFEYRVLSNFWVFDPVLIKWVFNNTRYAVSNNHRFTAKEGKEIQRIINEGDVDAARSFVQSYGIALPSGY